MKRLLDILQRCSVRLEGGHFLGDGLRDVLDPHLKNQ